MKEQQPNTVMARTSELAMQTATISDRTRNLLIVLGKITDLYTNLSDAVEPLYGESNLDEILDPTFTHFGNAKNRGREIISLFNMG